MKDKIKKRIEALSTRAEQLVQEREDASIKIDQINTEIAHIVGAIQELDSFLRENENEEKEKPQDESCG
jgi:methyl-accepting chemotaxis protein